jgi:hypothetical protein
LFIRGEEGAEALLSAKDEIYDVALSGCDSSWTEEAAFHSNRDLAILN